MCSASCSGSTSSIRLSSCPLSGAWVSQIDAPCDFGHCRADGSGTLYGHRHSTSRTDDPPDDASLDPPSPAGSLFPKVILALLAAPIDRRGEGPCIGVARRPHDDFRERAAAVLREGAGGQH